MQTEFEFQLPKGYVDDMGNLHRHGVMRLALAMDEIVPMRDLRVQTNRAYATVLILSRVILRLGALEDVSPAIIERLFAGDLNYLQDFYRAINGLVVETPQTAALERSQPSSPLPEPLSEAA